MLDSSDARRLIVLGTDDEHTKIEGVLAELAAVLEQPDTLLRVYPIEDRRLLAQTIVDSLDAKVTDDVLIQVNADANSLIVRGNEVAHERLKQAITALVEQLPPAPSLNTQGVSILAWHAFRRAGRAAKPRSRCDHRGR